MNSDNVIQAIQDYLHGQLGDAPLAQTLGTAVHDCLLDWTAPATELTGIGAIMAFSFGYRRLPNGNIVPGPMNDKLADVVVGLYGKLQCKVYAQWEIAEAIGIRVPSAVLHAVNPEINPKDATVKYLSTFGVAQKVLKCVGSAKSLGKVLVVAWRDHAPRCVRIARKLGFDAFVPPEPLPNDYDPESGQAWTRNRHAYLVHDGLSRLEAYRADVIGASSPSSQLD
jgi:hypothetical protein